MNKQAKILRARWKSVAEQLKLIKSAGSVLENAAVQEALNELKSLLVQSGTAKRRPGLQYRERFQGETKLTSPTYRDITVYEVDESKLADPEYKQQLTSAWKNAKSVVENALREDEGSPKNWKQYYADMDAGSPGEWLYNVESFIETAYEKTPEGKSYSATQKARQKAKDWFNGSVWKETVQLNDLLTLVESLETTHLKEWLKIVKFRNKRVSGRQESSEQSARDLLQIGARKLYQQRSSI